jgi:hypothetical protein
MAEFFLFALGIGREEGKVEMVIKERIQNMGKAKG